MSQIQNRQKFSLTELEKLCTLLRGRYAIITPGNAAAVVETLRAVAELMIWGDQVRISGDEIEHRRNHRDNGVAEKCNNKQLERWKYGAGYVSWLASTCGHSDSLL